MTSHILNTNTILIFHKFCMQKNNNHLNVYTCTCNFSAEKTFTRCPELSCYSFIKVKITLTIWCKLSVWNEIFMTSFMFSEVISKQKCWGNEWNLRKQKVFSLCIPMYIRNCKFSHTQTTFTNVLIPVY